MSLFTLVFSNLIFADQLVILNTAESLTNEVRSKSSDSAEYLIWEELHSLPLAFGPKQNLKSCLGTSVTLAELKESLQRAESSVAYLEVENALGHVRQIEGNLVCLNEPIPPDILVRSSYIAGVAFSYSGDMNSARAYWRSALIYNPELLWDATIEPSGKSTFEDEKKKLLSQATSRLYFMPENAVLTIDGLPFSNGESVIAGEHLIQHNANNYQGYLITTEMGKESYIVSFADFNGDLDVVMKDKSSQDQLLKSLLMIQDKTDIRVVTEREYWSLPLGTNTWKSQPLETVVNTMQHSGDQRLGIANSVPISSSSSDKQIQASRDIKKPLIYAGSSLLVAGATSLIVSRNHYTNFQSFDESTPEKDIESVWQNQRLYWYTGIGLSTIGTGLVITGTF